MNDIAVEEAIRYMWKHHSDSGLKFMKIADHVNYSRAHFSRKFKSKVGINVSEFLSRIRLYKACELLQDTQFNFYEICEIVGIGSVGTFGSKFTRIIGVPPIQFRNTAFNMMLIKSDSIFEVNLPCL